MVGAATGGGEVVEQAVQGAGSSGLAHSNNYLEGSRIEKCGGDEQVVAAAGLSQVGRLEEEQAKRVSEMRAVLRNWHLQVRVTLQLRMRAV